MISERVELIRDNFFRIVVLLLILTPSIYFVVDKLYYERLSLMREQISSLRESRDYYERKLEVLERRFSVDRLDTSRTGLQSSSTDSLINYNNGSPTKENIRKLVESYDLTKPFRTNPHLRFKEGDISYWYELGLSLSELKIEFEARRIVLERAEKAERIIQTQGDLSYLANQIKSELIRGRK